MDLRFILKFAGVVFLLWVLLLPSCTHEPTIIDMEPDPMDTTVNNSDPCDPDSIYFEKDLLPIFQSNCAKSGCHDAATATEGIILDSYENIVNTAEVVPFDLDDNDIYERITEDDIDKRMPPVPNNPLSQDQIDKIAQWILQGAKNIDCDENTGNCDTDNISFSGFVAPLIMDHCQGCHSGPAPTGGLNLSTYSGVKGVADSGRLFGVISWAPGFPMMPQGGPKLDQCSIDKIKSWIDAGAPNN